MANVRGFARLGTIAVGLGIGAAVAHSPVASADTSTDWLSAIDTLLAGGAFPALVTPALDYQISFDGYDLFPTTGNLATASTAVGSFGLAIAVGDGADASANSGIGNVAIVSATTPAPAERPSPTRATVTSRSTSATTAA
jgi:hypothetical protein